MKADTRRCLVFLSGVMLSSEIVTHSLRFLHTAAAGIPAFPEFVTVVLVDGQPFSYYDSQLRRELPRQSWTLQAEEPDFWERRTNNSIARAHRALFMQELQTDECV
uniref:MHC class I-like antigen recognition-like domain-containing protein n=1 Tax=Oryzias melastigma TaxID=30732 RepID=A0A3B3C861_ORYME